MLDFSGGLQVDKKEGKVGSRWRRGVRRSAQSRVWSVLVREKKNRASLRWLTEKKRMVGWAAG